MRHRKPISLSQALSDYEAALEPEPPELDPRQRSEAAALVADHRRFEAALLDARPDRVPSTWEVRVWWEAPAMPNPEPQTPIPDP